MCLLIVVSRTHPDSPLIVAANRDEWLSRPSEPIQVLQASSPRILGGKDKLANGTWLAVNEHGVVAGLTNQPLAGGRNPGKRSRGILPLALAAHRTAREAVAALAENQSPAGYNPCWLLVGDREALFYIDFTSGERPAVRELMAGTHVLENRPIDVPSAKVRVVKSAVANSSLWHGCALVDGFAGVLSSHEIPAQRADEVFRVEGLTVPGAVSAACVHAGPYGTRSSTLVILPSVVEQLPMVLFADGAPCQVELTEASYLWQSVV